MKRWVLTAAVLAATASEAQDAVLDTGTVAACFAGGGSAGAARSCIGAAAEACMEKTQGGYSTAGMAGCVAAEIDVWDGFLNREYKGLRALMAEADANASAGNVSRVDALRDTQRAWIAYRDAECGFNWAMFQEGTMRLLVAVGCRLDMTAQRSMELRDYRETPQ